SCKLIKYVTPVGTFAVVAIILVPVLPDVPALFVYETVIFGVAAPALALTSNAKNTPSPLEVPSISLAGQVGDVIACGVVIVLSIPPLCHNLSHRSNPPLWLLHIET